MISLMIIQIVMERLRKNMIENSKIRLTRRPLDLLQEAEAKGHEEEEAEEVAEEDVEAEEVEVAEEAKVVIMQDTEAMEAKEVMEIMADKEVMEAMEVDTMKILEELEDEDIEVEEVEEADTPITTMRRTTIRKTNTRRNQLLIQIKMERILGIETKRPIEVLIKAEPSQEEAVPLSPKIDSKLIQTKLIIRCNQYYINPNFSNNLLN